MVLLGGKIVSIFTVLQQLLIAGLRKRTEFSGNNFWLLGIAEQQSLKRITCSTPIIYSSAIAHQLAAYTAQPAIAWARELAAELPTCIAEEGFGLEPIVWLKDWLAGVRVAPTSTGLLHFYLDNRAIAAWLTFLQQPSSLQGLSNAATSRLEVHIPPQVLFQVQYAHARCCSLLQLANREQIIELEAVQPTAAQTWQMTVPAAIPWLSAAEQFCLHHPSTWGLIGSLLDSLDTLSKRQTRQPSRIVRQAADVSQAFETFYRNHPLLGGCPPLSLQQIHTCLGLLLATQRVLFLLLETGLGGHAPVEL
jgi:hypothetical protein